MTVPRDHGWNNLHERFIERPRSRQFAIAARDVALVSVAMYLWTGVMRWDATTSTIAVAVAAGFVGASRLCWLAGVPVFVLNGGSHLKHRRLAALLSWVLVVGLIAVMLALAFADGTGFAN